MDQASLTNAQSLMLAGQRLCAESPLYNMAFRFDLYGRLDVDRLCVAVTRVVRANEVLQLSVSERGELGVSPTAGEFAVTRVEQDNSLAELATQTLDLAVSCLRMRLYSIDEEHHVWYVQKHHLVTDGASFVQFFRQVAEVYAGAAPHENSFRRYVALEAATQQSNRLTKAREYWAKKRAVVPREPAAAHRLNTTRRTTLVLSREELAVVQQLAQRAELQGVSSQLTLFSIIAATLLTLRYRLFDPTDTTLGMPMHSGVRSVIGPTLEVGFIEVDVAGAASFLELVRQVRDDAFRALKNNVPGVSDSITNHSFSWLLNYVSDSFGDFAGLRVRSQWLHGGAGDAAQDLRVQVHDFDATGERVVHFDAATRAFSALQQEQLPNLFRALLLGFCRHPDKPLAYVPLVPTDAADGGNDLSVNHPAHSTPAYSDPVQQPGLLDRFLQQVASQPDTLALHSRDSGERYSYRALNQCADALAQAHKDLALWVLLLRGPSAVVAILAALKSNKPFVPLDVDHPAPRINAILDQLENPPVFVMPGTQGTDLKSPRCHQIDLQARSTDFQAPAQQDDTAAYIIFTSGTTGAPKGVVVGHPSLRNYVNWAAGRYAANQPVDMPLYSSLAFDLTITSVFLPLVSGGCVLTYGDKAGTIALSILNVMREGLVDVIKLTPSHLRLALNTRAVRVERLHSLIVGGENLARSLALDALDRWGQPTLYNEYGPTEATVGCMIHVFDPNLDRAESVPIGQPIHNSTVALVDHVGQAVPRGFDGQLILSGATLAEGYWQGERIAHTAYHTGDRARQLADGNYLYLGRMNSQVKFRGARVELAEIENALQNTGLVKASHIVLDELQQASQVAHCTECGIANNVPRIVLNTENLCNICEDYAGKRERVAPYFRSLPDLQKALKYRSQGQSDYDCLVLVSGGKDSSFTLCKIVELGLRPVVFTLDNGYLSQHALDNIERMTTKLGVPWVCESPEGMAAIFSDSLSRHSNVCNGCFKTIYTLATNYALKHAIPSIITGLSRGQLFETRLLDMVDTEVFDPQVIDARVKQARLAYHQIDDAVSELLDVSQVRDAPTFDKVEYFDFYRYCDASLDEMLAFLQNFGGWQRPPDTGRSTNCLINDVGIYVHKAERAHHNYAVPYAWDVRMGHKTRSQAVDELNDELDLIRVHEILDEIDYQPMTASVVSEQQLVAYYTSANEATDSQVLRKALQAYLPDYSIPTQFIELQEIPITPAGKVDRRALPAANKQPREYTAPASALEETLAALWANALQVDRVGRFDNFFELGGDSIAAVQLAVACASEHIPLEPTAFFSHPTLHELAGLVGVLNPDDASPSNSASQGETNHQPDTGLDDSELESLFDIYGETGETGETSETGETGETGETKKPK